MAVKISGVEVIDNSRNITTNVGTVDGRDIAADGAKLDGIEAGAEVNQNAFASIAVTGQSDVVADAKTDTVTFVAGTGVSITTNASTDAVTFTNSAPDQVVSLTGSGATSVSGTYPNFTISSTDNDTTYTAGSGLTLTGTTFSANIGTDILAYDANLQSFVNAFTLPTADGSTGQVLTTNGAGTLSFTTISGYTDADVDDHLNTSTAASGEVLSWNGTDYDWIAAPAALTGQTDSASPFETSLGVGAGAVNTGVNNTFIGFEAGNDNTTGTNNTAVGYRALTVNTTGANNLAIGTNALLSNTTGTSNTALGLDTLQANTIEGGNTAVGWEALRSTTSPANTAVGRSALRSVTSGNTNTALGFSSGYSLTTGSNNTIIGYNAAASSDTVSNEITLGNSSITRFRIPGLGVDWTSAPANLTGATQSSSPWQTRLGHDAGVSSGGGGSGQLGVFVGYQAGRVNTGSDNVAIGGRAFEFNTSGSYHTFVGVQSGFDNTTSFENVGVGYKALENATTGSNNTAIGSFSASSITTGTNNIVIGRAADASSATVSNEITLGNSSITTLRCQVTTITSLSDARDKTDIQPLNAGLEFVEALNPVSFTWNMRDGGKVGVADTGFIAQDLQKAQADTGVTIPDLVYDVNPDKLEAGYGKLIPVLVQAIKDLSAEVKTLKTQMEAQQ